MTSRPALVLCLCGVFTCAGKPRIPSSSTLAPPLVLSMLSTTTAPPTTVPPLALPSIETTSSPTTTNTGILRINHEENASRRANARFIQTAELLRRVAFKDGVEIWTSGEVLRERS
ncbi:hypothetical protein FQA47_014538 [Oryzias melastigma]|uniref:Hedgehog N-terminal signalling domain-containing protein n=1 Tax=Oryzias melastigma TaxID=30732 RepID=A0A834KZV6_ORYME|nr:hypothetical protein FQA47_014538 [Oryzias melastigma]